ncbi:MULTISPECIES: phage integrase SAM-like domain-containing protein [unclassified Carboxylicivirga]|uniref:phage integrase SAM-like domain-containing protein n=1 Tax=Carboxylicivirga TaxID=1628153 RepID=UPI003D326478
MNTSIVITLDTRREKKDGTYPIIFRLCHYQKTLPISTGYSVPEHFWDERNRRIKSNYKGIANILRANNFLEKERARYIDQITILKDKKEIAYLSIQELKQKLVPKKNYETFFTYSQELIDKLIEQKRIGTARSYKTAVNSVKKFRNQKDFRFNELNYRFVLDYEAYFIKNGYTVNGFASFMRTVRAIYNKAIKEGIAEKEGYPFDRYTIKMEPTKKRAISLESIQKIANLKYKPGSALFKSRNYFMMSFYLMGASFTDLAHLQIKNIVDGRIQYKRQKTGKYYDIKISPQLQKILDYYIKDKSKEDYILPVIRSEEPSTQYKHILRARKKYNKRLRLIAEDAGIETKLTSYVARHTFASLANNMAIPVTAISEMLGHQKLSTTQIYLASLNKKIIDNYNDEVISLI